MDGMVDIAVLGSGPAALSVAGAASAAGASVALIAPQPRAPWKPRYCCWADEIPDAILPLTERIWNEARVATTLGQRTIPRAYAKLDNEALQSSCWQQLERGAARVVPEPAAALEAGRDDTEVRTGSGAVVRARVVIDASGAATRFVRRVHQRPPAFQTAYGVLLHVPGHGFDLEQMTLMDFRPASSADSEPPSFLYALPLTEDRLFLEETSLARRPAMSMEVLRGRLQTRLLSLGLQDAAHLDEELCSIPMGLGLPAPSQQVVPFGAAAAMMHPASGYHIFHVLRKAQPVAETIVHALDAGGPQEAVAKGLAAVWPRDDRRLWELYQFGLETLLDMSRDDVSRFFEAFFELPREAWSGYLGATLDPSELGSAMTRLFRSLPLPVQWHLIRAGLWGGAAPLARSFFPSS